MSKVKKTIKVYRDTGYLERDAFERATPVSITRREKKEKKLESYKTYTKPSKHEFISSKQLNMPLLVAYEFVIAGTLTVVIVGVVFVSAILVQPREKRFKSSQ